jgi:hypothetical protein
MFHVWQVGRGFEQPRLDFGLLLLDIVSAVTS